MIRIAAAVAVSTLAVAAAAAAQETRVRTPVHFPDIPGYLTLKCDFHIHTVFSDGSVWPDVRPEEAWREGLDAIAITDHIEYQPHAADLPTAHDRSFAIAAPHGDLLSVIVIKGSEVTRDMPPGHLNAIFIEDAAALDVEEWREALRVAREQGGFIFWNHPGWTGQQPDGVLRWYPEHDELVASDRLHGIEVVNTREYYPEAHRLCLEKKLTMLSNSDVHAPANLDYHVHRGDHRPMTLVFATERSAEAIEEALYERRTAVYSGEMLVGEARFLQPIFAGSIEVLTGAVITPGEDEEPGSGVVQVHNASDLSYRLKGEPVQHGLRVPGELTLAAGRTVLLAVQPAEPLTAARRVELRYFVENLKTTPEAGLEVAIPIEVRPAAGAR